MMDKKKWVAILRLAGIVIALVAAFIAGDKIDLLKAVEDGTEPVKVLIDKDEAPDVLGDEPEIEEPHLRPEVFPEG